MTTSVTITGTGTPKIVPDRAGAGVLVRRGDVALQFDAGRATVLRLEGAGQDLTELDALFITHHHSDHIVGVPDLIMTRWLDDVLREGQADLPIYAPHGAAATIIERMLDVWEVELTGRQQHTQKPNIPKMDVRRFTPSKTEVTIVATFGDVTVSAISVEHDPVVPAVGYRIDTPDGSIVISGDTAICRQVADLSAGVDVLIHEALRPAALGGVLSNFDAIMAYHSECSEVGALAQTAGVDTLVLTHLLPAPETPQDKAAYESDIRSGGFFGKTVVAEDLTTIHLSSTPR